MNSCSVEDVDEKDVDRLPEQLRLLVDDHSKWNPDEYDLPPSVLECFQDSTSVGRTSTHLLTLFGRAARYEMRKPRRWAVVPLDHLKRKILQTHRKLIVENDLSSPITQREVKEYSRAKADSPRGDPQPGTHECWTAKGDSFSAEDIRLLKQALSLRHMAVDRRHCQQLCQIKDSLPHETSQDVILRAAEKDRAALRDFLLQAGFLQYYRLFNRHGYDLPTALKMDVLDLAAIGVSEPLHRMAIRFELQQVDLVKEKQCVPRNVVPVRNIPETIGAWLSNLRLEIYTENFQRNGIYCPLAAVGITKKDLQVMGVYLLGHRKKLMIALEELKELLLRKD